MSELKGGLIGCGFFARSHMQAWNMLPRADITAVCDADPDKCCTFQSDFNVPDCYTSAEEMLSTAGLDFVDIVTGPASHRPLVELAAKYRVPVICQKPMAPSLNDARSMVDACTNANIPFMIHENFRWQTPMQALKKASAQIGELFFGRLVFRNEHDLYKDQPYLATDKQFIIYDLGVHILDLARFFLGDAEQLNAITSSVNPKVVGEDVATMLLKMRSGAASIVEISYYSHLERDIFPQTLVHLEGSDGSAVLSEDFQITLTTRSGVQKIDASPSIHPWSKPKMAVVEDSVVNINRHWIECLQNGLTPETSGEDNLKTLELVFGAYQAAENSATFKTIKP